MSLTSAIAIFFVLWWLVFFAVLPFGVRTQGEDDEATIEGSPASAPVNPLLLRKAVITTVLAAVIFFGLYELIVVAGFGLDDIPFLPDMTPEGWEPNYERMDSQ